VHNDASTPTYPLIKRCDHVDDYHGTAVLDAYRQLEQTDSLEAHNWLRLQENLTERYFRSIPAADQIRKSVANQYEFARYGLPLHSNGRYFYTYNSGIQNQCVLMMSEKFGGIPNVVLDPNTLAADGSVALVDYAVSSNGGLLAYCVSILGSEWTEWRFRDVLTLTDLPDVIRFTKHYPIALRGDGTGVYYSAYMPLAFIANTGEQHVTNAIYYHAFGSEQHEDIRIFFDPSYFHIQHEPHISFDDRWLIVLCAHGTVGNTGSESVYAIDLNSKTSVPRPITQSREGKFVYIAVVSEFLYLLTTLHAPHGRVVTINLELPLDGIWQDIIPEKSYAIVPAKGAVTLAGQYLFVCAVDKGRPRPLVYSLDGTSFGEVELPGIGVTSGFGGTASSTETFYTYTDLVTPHTVYHYDLATRMSKTLFAPGSPFESTSYVQEQVYFPSKDGVSIPMLVAHHKEIALDGSNPTILHGYGGFSVPWFLGFDPARAFWLSIGGIVALPNLRGGGEFGENWHRQAIREHKQVSFDDMIAAAEWLISSAFTCPHRLAMRGAASGGLVVGACLTQRPELFGAAITEYAIFDMLRFNQFGQPSEWKSEYGSPSDPDEFLALLAYSPVHNVREGLHYPATLLITGEPDSRVPSMHSHKFAAALQAAQCGLKPILLDSQAPPGHAGVDTLNEEITTNVRVCSFLVDALSIYEAPPLLYRRHFNLPDKC
jgi:prolyl oligopeptidase